MRREHLCRFVGLAGAALLVSGVWMEKAAARGGASPPHDRVALGENEVKNLVLLMDQDKNGKVSRQEFMNFMQAEFKRLDNDNSGELDVKELKESQIRPSKTFLSAGK
jgi:hypothetical protein